MSAIFIITRLNNDGVTLKAVGGRVELRPKQKVSYDLRMLVARHKAELLAELERWPNREALARNFFLEPPRPDELGRSVRRPEVLLGRRPFSARPKRR